MCDVKQEVIVKEKNPNGIHYEWMDDVRKAIWWIDA